MKNHKLIIAHFQTQQQAENAIIKLKKYGYDITKLSIIGTECYIQRNVVGYYTIYDRMEKWSSIGLFAVGLTSIVFGSLFFFNLMNISAIKMPIIYACIAILTAASISLIAIAFSKNRVIEYRTEIRARKFMLCADDSSDKIKKIQTILEVHLPKENSPSAKENQMILEN
ncbi:hypothetical protein [Flavobacterium sp. HBTb2-11-1]|uniref:hypothetical protein n=1 Tax=Flavobacterium sp. HBTb2-11-1 TaxID=2692212 RepID=UPI001368B2FF|nr:hypothetical protein [Flavobacterium sp. HBTb2-11-1]MXO06712.1 hypothetical protein [Flavobacterium sp. HBTb2-11-1]